MALSLKSQGIPAESEWVLIDGIKWATRNVDMPGKFAATPQDAGMFYQWNRKVGWSTTDPLVNSDGGTTWDNSEGDPTDNTWEKANDPCPAGWRVPTWKEMRTLTDMSSEWTTINGVNGRTFGSDNDVLFLPAAGYRYFNSTLNYVGMHGFYWSSSSYGFWAAHLLYFNNTSFNFYTRARKFGFSVRCVVEE